MPRKFIAAMTVSGNSPKTRTVIEKSGQTFKEGVPVMIDAADGGVKEWTGTVATDMIAGISAVPAVNLSATGADAPQPFQPYTGTGAVHTFGNVPNQPNAVNLLRGGPFTDGRTQFYAAVSDTEFLGAVGDAQVTAVTDVGVKYGLTKDGGTGLWYIDKTKTGANACIKIERLHPNDGAKTGGRVFFTILPASAGITG